MFWCILVTFSYRNIVYCLYENCTHKSFEPCVQSVVEVFRIVVH